MEWTKIREVLLNRRADDAVVPVHMDDSKIPGWPAVSFGIVRRDRSAQQIAAVILDFIKLRQKRRGTASASTLAPIMTERQDYLNQQVALGPSVEKLEILDRQITETQRALASLKPPPSE